MKLQRAVNLKAYGKTYYRWQVFLPDDLVKELKWNPGQELEGLVKGDELRLRRKSPSQDAR